MKKRFAALALAALLFVSTVAAGAPASLSAAAAGDDSISVSYSFGDLTVAQGDNGQVLDLEGLTKINDPGNPNLPSKSVSILLPAGAQVRAVSVDTGSTQRMGSMLVEPTPEYFTVMEHADEDGGNAESIPQTEEEPTADPAAETPAGESGAEAEDTRSVPAEEEQEPPASEADISEPAAPPAGEEPAAPAADPKTETEPPEAEAEVTPPPAYEPGDEAINVRYNEDIYVRGDAYPPRPYSDGQTVTARGFSIYTIVLYPVSYQDGEVLYTPDMTLSIQLESADRGRRIPGYVPDESDTGFLTEQLDNIAAADSYFGSETPATRQSALLGGGTVDYVIITTPELASAFEPLAAHKQSRGFASRVVLTTDIYANYSGRDDAECIRNFLIDAYQANRIRYVLLGGDADAANPIVPTRILYCPPVNDGVTTEIASDMYYGCLDGNYDYNNNGIYGEPKDGPGGGEVDLAYDVYVGRAPADTLTEAQNFVTKTINNENRTKQARVTLVGEVLEENSDGCSSELAAEMQTEMEADTLTDTLRWLRDSSMKQEYVDLYYEANDFIKSLLISDPGMLLSVAGKFVQYYSPLSAYLQTGASDYTLTSGDISDLQALCNSLKSAAQASDFAYDGKDRILQECEEFSAYLAGLEGADLAEAIENSKYYERTGDTAVKTGTSRLFGGDYMDEIKNGATSNRSGRKFTTKGFPTNYIRNTLYDRDAANYKWDKSRVVSEMNGSPEVINHLGHCNNNHLMRCKREDMASLTNSEAFFLYSQGCYPGAFDNMNSDGLYEDEDCVAEVMLLNSPTSGAYACVVNSRYGWYTSGSTDGASQAYNRYFWDRVFSAGADSRQLGIMLAQSKEYFIDYLTGYDSSAVMRFCYYEQNLLGDPAFSIYNASSQQMLSVSRVPTTRVSLNVGGTLTIARGKRISLRASVTPVENTDSIRWTSSKNSVATVNQKGVVTARRAGTATITARTSSGKTSKLTIRVPRSVKVTKSIKLNKSSVSVVRGKTAKLRVSIKGSSVGKKWYSSNPAIATVSSSGVVTGRGQGKCVIYCRTASGKRASCKVTVTLPPLS